MKRGSETPVEAGCVGGCLGILGGLAIIPSGLVIYAIAALLGDQPPDGSLGFGIVAVPLALLTVTAIAYYMASRGDGHRYVATASAILGFAGFCVAFTLLLITGF